MSSSSRFEPKNHLGRQARLREGDQIESNRIGNQRAIPTLHQADPGRSPKTARATEPSEHGPGPHQHCSRTFLVFSGDANHTSWRRGNCGALSGINSLASRNTLLAKVALVAATCVSNSGPPRSAIENLYGQEKLDDASVVAPLYNARLALIRQIVPHPEHPGMMLSCMVTPPLFPREPAADAGGAFPVRHGNLVC